MKPPFPTGALCLLGCLFLLGACSTPAGPTDEAARAPTPAPDAHTSRNALDWAGTYSGTVPCADCEGIATQLTLNTDGTYTLRTAYLGKNTGPFVQEGSFTWKDDGNHIVLQGNEGRPGIYQVGEERLIQRDLEGKPITGDLADRYVLNKAATPGAVSAKQPLEGTRWQLVEVMGKPVPVSTGAGAHLILTAQDKRAAGNAGCNSFFAGYELDEAKGVLRFTQAGSTMMACPDMSVEDAFMKALQQVDNYTLGEDGRLSLNKGRMAPLLRFEAGAK
ncbi:MAG: copper resistance protein NlpE N-terminal domain-containing protein [Flavobacteriales bacterium]|nr:copper resistance protein NlpE N-terminal domain-containing protein [Flavobacteriales bacterium]